MPVINMNPLGAAGQQVPQPARIEQAMMAQAAPAPVAQRAAPSHYAEAVGFGRDLPLALAVSQIVPPDFAFSFDTSVNPGDNVSWEGGKPWDQVLNETLSPVGASARIDAAKKEITIVTGSAGHNSIVPASYSAPQAPRPPAPSLAAPAMVSPMPAVITQDVAPLQAIPPMTARPSAIATVLDPKAVNLWQAERGSTLRRILEDWSMRAGVELFWSSDFDFPVSSAVRINGTFEEAVQTLLNGLRDAQPRPIGRLHPNLPDGPSVLIVETRHVLQ